ncbi:MAG: NAD-glutamate dehydrogenase, partial [Hyphomicrobiaceae bacterium]|nr:NAD-glutamate dehydrogenase [Hyphomicrobiaceae bacterium]
MTDKHDAHKARIVDAAVRLIEADANAGDSAARFARALFARGAPEDLVVYSPAELASVALDCYRQMADRVAGSAHVRVYNPTVPGDSGPLGDVTIVEIVNDNMPFLVDSAMGELQETGAELRVVLHPVLWVARNTDGHLTEVFGNDRPQGQDAIRESVIVFHIDRMESVSDRDGLEERLAAVLSDVRLSVRDWQAMRRRLEAAVRAYKDNPPPLPVDEIAEAIQFGDWLLDDNFTFLGMREYAFEEGADGANLTRSDSVGLGILSDPDVRVLRRGREFVVFTPELFDFLKRPEPLIVTKANVKSRVHRRAHMDYVGVKLYDEDGNLTGELRVIGLFSATAYTRSTARIPLLRRKIALVMERAGYDPDSHSGRVLLNVLESYPRDELFQLDIETLYRFSMAVMQLSERPRIRALARIDRFDRFVSILVYVPRERYSTTVRIRIGEYFAEVYKGRVSAWYVAYPEGPLARVHFIIGRYEGKTPQIPQDVLEADIANIVRTWTDKFRTALDDLKDPTRSRLLLSRYGEAFSDAYREAFDGAAAVDDALTIEKLTEANTVAIRMREREEIGDGRVDLKIYHHALPIPLSDRIPILESMGMRAMNERTYRVTRRDTPPAWLHDVSLERADGGTLDLETDRERIEATFMAVWSGMAENDGFNRLVVNADLPWRDVAMLRALSRYLRQARLPFSQDYISEALNRHTNIARSLVDLFHARFDPARSDAAASGAVEKIVSAIQMDLDAVTSLDDDTIIRRYLNLMDAMLRTNFFQPGADGRPKPTFAFKFDSKKITDLPEPRPLREIFVYSPRVEGVHLRGGMIARGGLRWSDRPQDFRTEV